MSLSRSDFQVISDWITPNSSVLDLGCGNGELLSELSNSWVFPDMVLKSMIIISASASRPELTLYRETLTWAFLTLMKTLLILYPVNDPAGVKLPSSPVERNAACRYRRNSYIPKFWQYHLSKYSSALVAECR